MTERKLPPPDPERVWLGFFTAAIGGLCDSMARGSNDFELSRAELVTEAELIAGRAFRRWRSRWYPDDAKATEGPESAPEGRRGDGERDF